MDDEARIFKHRKEDYEDTVSAWQRGLKFLHRELRYAQEDLQRAVNRGEDVFIYAAQADVERLQQKIRDWEEQRP
jgi:hypothetical protein